MFESPIKRNCWSESIASEGVPGRGELTLIIPGMSKTSLLITRKPGSKPKVLVMDADPSFLFLIAITLQSAGFETHWARNGDEAIQIYGRAVEEGRPFDNVVLDVNIASGRGGRDTLAGLLTIGPNVKALLMADDMHDPVVRNFAAYGFKGVLQKPLNGNELDKALYRLMAN